MPWLWLHMARARRGLLHVKPTKVRPTVEPRVIMPPMARLTRMGALKIADPTKWLDALERAMRKAEGRIPVAAEELNVSVRQLSRWLAEHPEIPRCGPGRPWT